jgi:hypothetical protein
MDEELSVIWAEWGTDADALMARSGTPTRNGIFTLVREQTKVRLVEGKEEWDGSSLFFLFG